MRFFVPLYIIFFIISASVSYAQPAMNFEDGFEDGDFTADPAWMGDTDQFAITQETNYLLQLSSSTTDPAYLSTPSESIDGSWEFYVEFDGFEPSGSNRAEIFLMSDIPDLEGPVNGYAVQVGQSGDDVFQIVRYDNGSQSSIVLSDTTVVSSSGGGYRLKVVRDSTGHWQLEVGKGYDGILHNSGSSAIDNEHSSSSYFGVRVKFTSSRSEKFLFDFKIDLPPFAITQTAAEDNYIDVKLNRSYDPNSVTADDFMIDNGIGTPSSLAFPASEVIRLTYDGPIPGGKYTLSVLNLEDLNGLELAENTSSFIVLDSYSFGDIIINEFVYDPPAGGAEYVELVNTSDKYLDISNWQLGDDNALNSITDARIIEPDSYVVISADTAALFSIFGHRPYIQMNTFPALNNTGDAVRIITDSGERADSLTYMPDWGGEDVSLERRSASVASHFQENWGESPHPLDGTPGSVNEVADDITSPGLLNIEVIDSRHLMLAFHEQLDSTTALTPSFYSVNGGPDIYTVRTPAPDSVGLTLSSSLANAATYTLEINGVADIFGNITAGLDTTFTYYEISPVDSGDVYINEFMYDPPDESTEYIEIYNASSKSLDLHNWTLNDNTGQQRRISSDQLILPPDSRIVIAPDNTLLSSIPNLTLVTLGHAFPTLNNGGDNIVLRNSEGQLLDSLTYTSDWEGRGTALERRITSVSGIYPENWDESPNGFGTPGAPNDVDPDKTPPRLSHLQTIDSNIIHLAFDEAIHLDLSLGQLRFTLSGDISISSVSALADDRLELALSSDLQNAVSYTLELEGIADIFGNTSSVHDTVITYYEIFPSDSGEVFINEFMYDPPEETPEYIEILNVSDKSLDLNGWTLNDNTGNVSVITTEQVVLPPDSLLIIASDNTLRSVFTGIRLITMGQAFPTLNNSGDRMVLKNERGLLLDSLTYTNSWNGNEVALERKTTSVSGIYSSNWQEAPNGFGTPGRANDAVPDTSPPRLVDLNIENESAIRLTFDEILNPGSTEAPSSYYLSNGIKVSQVLNGDKQTVDLLLSSNLQNATSYSLSIQEVADIFGNKISRQDTTFTYYRVSDPDSGDVFINEFMYNPPAGISEYIEIYNISNKSLDLNGWTVSDNTGNERTITGSQLIVPPDSFAVIGPDNIHSALHTPIIQTAMGSGFPALNNSGDDIVLKDNNGQLLDSLRYTQMWGGKEQALERITTSVAATFSSNWGTSPGEPGTPGHMNLIKPDSLSPRIADAVITDSSSIRLTFNEAVNASSIVDTTNYILSGDITVQGAELITGHMVELSLYPPLQNARSYTLTVQGVPDIFGNVLSLQDTTLTYFALSTPDSGDVLVNEFMYDPPPGDSEYIELHNPSDKSLDLSGWTINDNTGTLKTITDKTLILPPLGYIVIAPDETLLQNHPDVFVVTMGSRFPALNNNGDDIVLKNPAGQPLDSLRYTASWGGKEAALERRSTSHTGVLAENWGEAPGGTGTPGKPNALPPDETPPALVQLTVLDEQAVQLTFSERLDSLAAASISGYTVQPKRKIESVSVHNNYVTLHLTSPLKSDQKYQVTATGLQDVFGNIMEATTLEVSYIRLSSAQPGDIVINEILYTRRDASDPEFIELYNISEKNFDLQGWSIGDATGTTTLNGQNQLRSGEYLVLTDSRPLADSLSDARYVPGFPSLNDTGDAVFIQTAGERTIDSLYYRADWNTTPKGISIERRDPLAASNDASNWHSSSDAPGYSAGIVNTSFLPDETPPGLLSSKMMPDGTIEVQFNEFIRLTPDLSFLLGKQVLNIKTFDPDNADRVTLLPVASKADTETKAVSLTANNLTDVRGNITGTAETAVAYPLESGTVVINEIMFNPLNNPDDNQPDQSEYVELRNTRDYAVSLEGLHIHDAPDENGEVRAISPAVTEAKWVPPQGVALIYADEDPAFDKSRTARFFNIEDTGPQSAVWVDRNTLSLASSGDAIYLADSTGTVIDSVYYEESWHNPNLIDTRGIALERINPAGPGNDPANWSSSTRPEGGTPLAENSLFQEPGKAPDRTGITFAPNPFSPDSDGYEDNLLINYKLDEADYLIKVQVYDRYGRIVRRLTDGKRAGFEGTLIWDGRKDDGTRNRIGIYIIVFEAFNSANGKSRAFKETVVLARRLN